MEIIIKVIYFWQQWQPI